MGHGQEPSQSDRYRSDASEASCSYSVAKSSCPGFKRGPPKSLPSPMVVLSVGATSSGCYLRNAAASITQMQRSPVATQA